MNPDPIELPGHARRTKIVCTLGPASSSPEMIEKLIAAGMNVVRVNMSHGDHQSHAATIGALREVSARLGVYVPVLLDLSGPKMRIGALGGGSVVLKAGDTFVITTEDVRGNWERVSINYPPLIRDLRKGNRILMGDGEIELCVTDKRDNEAICEVVVGGELKSHKGVNAPGVQLQDGVPTEKDIADVEFGIAHRVDWLALSFVRSVSEVEKLRALLEERGAEIPIVVKVEKREALERIDELLDASNGLMVARGDLGLEMPIEQVPLIQKDLIRSAGQRVKPVITATQMLESMMDNPRPTRAEANDVANAVFDGTDAIMLSGETASGKYPVEAVRVMASIALASESRIDYAERFTRTEFEHGASIPEAIARAACYTAIETGAKVIVCCTRSGQTALQIANHRPPAKIAVVSPQEDTLLRTMLYWHTHPIKISVEPDTDAMIRVAREAVLVSGIAQPGDRVVIVAGVPVDVPGTTNMVKADVL